MSTHSPVDASASIHRDALIADCSVFEDVVRATATDLQAMRPLPDAPALTWLGYLIKLQRLHATQQSGGKGPDSIPRFDEQAAADLQALSHARPIAVPMSDGSSRMVYPKGSYAMHRIVMIEQELRWVLPRRVAVEARIAISDSPTPEALVALANLIEAQSVLEREFVWIVTHPGAGVPWPNDGVREHVAPEWTRDVGGYDFDLLRAAYIEISHNRSLIIVERTRAFQGAAEPLSPDAFDAIMANEAGIPTSKFVHEWSHGEATAAAYFKWEASERADARAKQTVNG